MGHGLGAGAELKHRKKFCAGIDGQPQPQHLRSATQPGAQLVQLEVREREREEKALVQGVCVSAYTREPSRHRGLSKALRPARRRKGRALRKAAESTTAICWEGGFNRDKGVSRRAVNVVRQA